MQEKIIIEGEFGKISGVLNSVSDNEEIVIVIHGLGATKEKGARILSEELAEAGVNSLRIDLDNLGESDLDFKEDACITNYVTQVLASIEYARKRGYRKINLLGTSFGGAVALSTAMKDRSIHKIFLRAPTLDFQKDFLVDMGKKKLEEFKEKGYATYDGDRYFSMDCYYDAEKYSMSENAHKIKQKIMIIVGDNDRWIDYKRVEEIAPLFPDANLQIIKGADHSLGVQGDYSKGLEILKRYFSE